MSYKPIHTGGTLYFENSQWAEIIKCFDHEEEYMNRIGYRRILSQKVAVLTIEK